MSDQVENLKLLIKFLGMTRSANNAEALVAMRKANEHLDRTKATWEELLMSKVKITIVEDPFKHIPTPPAATSAPTMRQAPPPRPHYATPSRSQPPFTQQQQDYSAGNRTIILNDTAKGFVHKGDRIEAIKVVRGLYNCSIPEANEAVIDYENSWKASQAKAKAARSYDPFAAKPTPQARNWGQNQYPGVCHKCGTRVGSAEGFLDGKTASGQFRIVCAPGKCKTSKYAKSHINLDDLADMT